MIGDRNLSWELYRDALTSDYNDIQGGTTGEGIHAGVMAGTILVALQTYAGVDIRSGKPVINPCLPDAWRSMSFNFMLTGNRFFVNVTKINLTIRFEGPIAETGIEVNGKSFQLKNNISLTIGLQ
jgi:trehalose/maltose hydrolase-like predicted phosphorylase